MKNTAYMVDWQDSSNPKFPIKFDIIYTNKAIFKNAKGI